ncbi:phage tail tube protein [Sphingomonas sp.]|uniref:phage tail tube protein n=1 Tax=Sphingomonas sp. TaxID=28214 RepID=UPI003CC574E1
MPTPIKWKSKTILLKNEATYGTDPTPTGGANAMLLTDVTLQPMEGQDVSRNLELPYLAAQEQIPTGVYVVMTGSFELVGGAAAGTAPAWGPALRACGVAEVITAGSKVEYSPISDNQESCGVYFGIGPSKHVILGARATVKCQFNAQGIPVGGLTITGLFSVPADAAAPTIDVTSWQAPQVVTATNTPTFTIGGIAFVMRSFEMDLGNDVQPRMLVGSERIVIVDRQEAIATVVEAQPYANYNPFSIANARTKQAIQLIHGTVVGKRVKLDIPVAQQKRPTGFQNAQGVLEWPLGFVPLPSSGNDQWKLTVY